MTKPNNLVPHTHSTASRAVADIHIAALQIIILSACFGFSSLANAQRLTDAELQAELVAGSSQLNKNLPFWINKYVRLDSSRPDPGFQLTYLLTVFPGNRLATVEDLAPERVRTTLCNDMPRRPLLLNGVVFAYTYRREDLKHLATYKFSAKDCGLASYR